MQDVFPSETAGDGQLRKQYLKNTDGQGLGLKLHRVACKNCGFTGCNTDRHIHSGGSMEGNGGLAAPVQQDSGPDANQANSGGCPLCGSYNYTNEHPKYNEFSEGKQDNILI